jgi:chromosome segregation ATPase
MSRKAPHKTKLEPVRSSNAEESRGAVSLSAGNMPAGTRVDAPHEAMAPAREVPADEPIPAPKLVPDESVCQQIGLQAAQLSTHLRTRQEELDHREAELNSRIASLESDARAARLWLDQHEGDLTSRAEALDERDRELAARLSTVGDMEQDIARRTSELAQREAELAEQEQETRRRLARLVTVEESLQRNVSVSDIEHAEELERVAKALDGRRQWLDRAEQQLAASQSEVQELCEQLAADHRDFTEQSAALREQIAAERREAMDEIEDKRQSVERRAKHVDESAAALRQLRGELERVHRETLEIRLATEELWARLSDAAPPAALTQSLGRIRAKLAEQHRQTQIETAEQKKELEAIRAELLAQHERLVEQKRQFEQWAAACYEDCQQQASRLVAREAVLHDREIEIRHQSQRWQAERLRLQIGLRRLQPLGAEEEVAAAAN